MDKQALETKAKKYANELNTFAFEYGFTSEEGWCLVPTSETKKVEIEKKFYPTLSVAIQLDFASEFQSLALSKMKHLEKGTEEKIALESPINKNVLYLTAYNPNRKS